MTKQENASMIQKVRNEAAEQFNEIWEDHHNPAKRFEKRLKARREERERLIRQDKGL